jgi:hypothetical protein
MNENSNRIIGAYKQTNALLMGVGILLGSYTISGSGLNNILASLIAIVVVIYGAYQYYKIDNKIGIFLILLAILWTIGYLLLYFKVFTL